MPSLIDENTQFTDENSGTLIVNGFIHIGAKDQDPTLLVNKITIYSDRELTVVLANPQRTNAEGRSVNKIWVPGKYSLVVQNSESVQKLEDLDAGELSSTGITGLTNIVGVDTITADGSPTITSLVDKQIYQFTATGTITGPVTVKIDATPTQSLLKYHDQPLIEGDIEANQTVSFVQNETEGVFELLSPSRGEVAKGADIASSATLSTPSTAYADVTGTSTITAIATSGVVGSIINRHFDSIVNLIHSANLELPNGDNVATEAGSEISFIEYAVGQWRLLSSNLPIITSLNWLPTLQDTSFSDAEGQTYNAGNYGYSTKIGDRVFIEGVLDISSIGTLTGASAAFIANIPYTSNGLTAYSATISFGKGADLAITAQDQVSGAIGSNDTFIELLLWNATTGTSAMTVTEVTGLGFLTFSGHYRV